MADFDGYHKAMVLVPKFPAVISLCASAYIVQHVLRDGKRRNLTYHRLLCCMSISDIIGSFGLFLSSWPMPRGEGYLAAGNVQTCIAHGFFNQAATVCTPCYNVSLASYYFLVIVRGWKKRRIVRVEKYLLAAPVIVGLGTGIAGIVLKLYNTAGHLCWIAPGLPNHPENHNPNYGIYRVAFMYAIIWSIILFLAISMGIIYHFVLQQEKRMDRYLVSSIGTTRRDQSRKIRNQAFLYIGSMYMTWLFGSIVRMMHFFGGTPPHALSIVFVFFVALQGFFNLIVYKSSAINEKIDQFWASNSLPSSCCVCMIRKRGQKKFAEDVTACRDGVAEDGPSLVEQGKGPEEKHKQNMDEEAFANTINELTTIVEC